jgi:hypothetical protein
LAGTSNDVTVGRVNSVMAIVQNLGFGTISQIGVHMLGSKAGIDSPSTQPAERRRVGDAQLSPDVEKARTLWNDAIDAEINRDFATAVQKYSQIKQLDPQVWPKTLDRRLGAARQQLPADAAASMPTTQSSDGEPRRGPATTAPG